MLLMKCLFFLWIWSQYLWNQGIQKWKSVVLKLVILNYFENIELNPTLRIWYDHIHKVCVMVFCRISYTSNLVRMTLFQKYKVFYSKTKRLRICIEKVACRYYMQLSLVAYKEQKGQASKRRELENKARQVFRKPKIS